MQDLETLFKRNLPSDIDFASLRFVEETTDVLNLRKGNLEPLSESIDRGIMITVFKDGGLGYASTANISERGIKDAIERLDLGHLILPIQVFFPPKTCWPL